MESPNILTQDKERGFTFVEILIVMVIMAIIVSLGLIVSIDFYKSYSFRSERNIIASILQKARSQSLNNINQTRHGVHFEDSSGLKYILFECPAITPNCASYDPIYPQIEMASSWGSSISNLPIDVIFNQIDGNLVDSNCSSNPSTVKDITVTYESTSYNISINCEGRINW